MILKTSKREDPEIDPDTCITDFIRFSEFTAFNEKSAPF